VKIVGPSRRGGLLLFVIASLRQMMTGYAEMAVLSGSVEAYVSDRAEKTTI